MDSGGHFLRKAWPGPCLIFLLIRYTRGSIGSMHLWNIESGENMTNRFHEIGKERQLFALYMIAKLGSVRPADIDACLGLDDPFSIKQAERTLRQLTGKKYVAPKPNALGTTSFVLTHRGARYLRSTGLYDEAKSGKDLSPTGPTFYHRTLSTLAMMVLFREHMLENNEFSKAYTEYEMQRKLAPIGASGQLLKYQNSDDDDDDWMKFAPDGLIEVKPHIYRWIEVEASHRSLYRLRKKIRWLAGGFDDSMGELRSNNDIGLGQLRDIIWVIPVGDGWYDHERRLKAELEALEVVTHPHRWTFLRLNVSRRLRLLDYSFESWERHKSDSDEAILLE